MISKNIIILVFILLLIGLVFYFYYYFDDETAVDEYRVVKKNGKKKAKKVRFNNKVEYNTYNKESDIITSEPKVSDIKNSPYPIISSDSIIPNNFDEKTDFNTWDTSFGFPLMSREEKQDYFNRMQKNYQKYEKSIGEFYQYQTDRSSIIETESTINPFRPDHRSESLKGRPIKDIYDQQVAPPRAKPKRVKRITDVNVIYENESENNGGNIPGSNLHAYDNSDNYQLASFGNGF